MYLNKNILIKAIKIGIVLILFTPLVVGFWGLNASGYPKAVFFRSLVEITFVFYVFLILLDKKYIPKKSILIISILLFNITLIVSGIAGINFYRSFFGEMQRAEGIILHLHLFVFFIMLVGVFLEKEEWIRLFKVAVIVSGVSSLTVILQKLNIASFYGLMVGSGTLSNSNLFGDYIVLSIFLTFFLIMAEQKKYFKIIWIFLAVLNCYTLLLSSCRGALFGFLMGLIFLLFFYFFSLNYKKRTILLVGILVLSIFILFVSFNFKNIELPKNSFFSRIAEIDYNFNGRTEIWKMSLVAFKERPLLGWGTESFSFIFDKYFKSSYSNFLVDGIYYDRPHNKVIEILVSNGILGIISYLSIFSVIFYFIFKHTRRPFSWLLSAFFISFFFQNIFSFDSVSTYILFFLTVGFINPVRNSLPKSPSGRVNTGTISNGVNNNFFNFSDSIANKAGSDFIELKLIPPPKIVIAFLTVLFTAVIFYQLNIKPTIAAMYFPNSIKYEDVDVKEAFSGYKKGIEKNTLYDADLRLAFTDRALFLLENGKVKNIEEDVLKKLLEIKPLLYKDLENKNPRINHLYEYLARINEWAYLLHKNPDDLDEMEEVLKLAAAFNPEVSIFYQLLGELRILQDKNLEGEEYIKKSCGLSHLGCSNPAELNKKIGIAYFRKGDLKKAIENFQKMLDIDYLYKKSTGNPAIESVGQFIDAVAIMYYSDFNDFENCKKTYERGIEIYPEHRDILKAHLDILTAENNKSK